MRLEDLANKDVVILGAARECGSVIAACRRLDIPARFVVIDESTEGPLEVEGVSVDRSSDLSERLSHAQVVVRSPGFSRYRPELQAHYQAGRVTTATKLWFAEPHHKVIGITGTKGKSTTSALIAHLLEACGLSVRFAGNIGASPLSFIGEEEPDCWVVEMSSFQASDLETSPDVGVLTTLSPEHLDWHGSAENYFQDKLNLFAHNPNITVVANVADAGVRAKVGQLPGTVVTCEAVKTEFFPLAGKELFPTSACKLAGRHNLQLASLALHALRAAGVDVFAHVEALEKAMSNFVALPHRLAVVREREGVVYINDSLATNPLATMAAIDAFSDRPTTVLLGGHDRGVDYQDLARDIADRDNVRVVAMPANGTRIAKEISAKGNVEIHYAGNLTEAVNLAAEITPEGGAVLLSPGAASFGEFHNYAERGDAFTELVKAL